MGSRRWRVARRAVSSVVLLAAVGMRVAWADQIRLKDGTEVSATLVDKDGENVVVRIPRASVDAVNGEPLPPPVIAGSKAPDFTAVDLQGATHTMADNRGHVTLLQFWASWCPHCRSDVPLMKKLFTSYREKGLRLVTVSVDQSLEALQTLIRDQQLAYPVIAASTYRSVPELYESRGIPAYYLIDAQGTIAKVWHGSVTESTADLEETLTRLLGISETAAAPVASASAPPSAN